MPLKVYFYISTPSLQRLYSYIKLTAIFYNLFRHSETEDKKCTPSQKEEKNEWICHIFVAFFPMNPYKYFMKQKMSK